MALLRDVVCKARPTVTQLINQEIEKLNLKILNKLTIKFDPFRNDVEHIRDFSYYIHQPQARASNLKANIKTEILTDRSDHSITFDLTNGHQFIFKCANLKTLEIFKLINEHITPLSPIEEVTTATAVPKLARKGESTNVSKKGKKKN